jgi:hypothetical protein
VKVSRLPVRDEYTEDGETVVLLQDGRVVALTPVPSAVLALVDDGARDVAELTERVVAEFGAPPGTDRPESAIEQVLAGMSELGLVALTTTARDL